MVIWQIVTISILLLISALAKSVMDKISFHFSTSVFKNVKNPQYWNPAISWKNKYNNLDSTQGFKKITLKIPMIVWKRNG